MGSGERRPRSIFEKAKQAIDSSVLERSLNRSKQSEERKQKDLETRYYLACLYLIQQLETVSDDRSKLTCIEEFLAYCLYYGLDGAQFHDKIMSLSRPTFGQSKKQSKKPLRMVQVIDEQLDRIHSGSTTLTFILGTEYPYTLLESVRQHIDIQPYVSPAPRRKKKWIPPAAPIRSEKMLQKLRQSPGEKPFSAGYLMSINILYGASTPQEIRLKYNSVFDKLAQKYPEHFLVVLGVDGKHRFMTSVGRSMIYDQM